MEVPEPLVRLIADEAVKQPFRQSTLMDSERFARWLQDRGLRLAWTTLHHLAMTGLLRPVLVIAHDEPRLQDGRRFRPYAIEGGQSAFLDLGTVVAEADIGPPLDNSAAPHNLRGALLWHPFQLWEVEQVARRLELPIALQVSLQDSASLARLVATLHDQIRRSLTRYAQSEERGEFAKILAVLVAVEPAVITQVDTKIRLNSFPQSETLEEYYRWVEQVDWPRVLEHTHLTVDRLLRWHSKLATAGQVSDPNERWRTVIRYAPRDKRLRFKNDALKAEEFYYAAEVIRRYVERYFGRTDVPEEDDVGYGQQGPTVKQRVYGSPRTTDFNRSVFRQVVRQFDLDPQPRLRWLVEGDTECWSILRLAARSGIDLRQWGVEVVSLQGLGGIESDRTRTLLTISQEEEVFVSIMIDYDGIQKNPGILRHYSQQGLVPAGFRVFNPNFEEASFSLQELVDIGNKLSTLNELDKCLGYGDVAKRMKTRRESARRAIFGLLGNRISAKDWGEALANHAFERDAALQSSKDGDDRDVVTLFQMNLRARSSNYKFTVEESYVDESGRVLPKAK